MAVFCGKCGTRANAGDIYCRTCQAPLGAVRQTAAESAPGAPAGGAAGVPEEDSPAGGAGRNHVIILGYEEWYLIRPRFDLYIDGRKVAKLGYKERFDYYTDENCIELEARSWFNIAAKVFGARRCAFKCEPGVTVLRMTTNRFTGMVGFDQMRGGGV